MPLLDPTVWMLVFTRTSGLLVSFPVLSARGFPTRLRLALGVMVACLISPGVPQVSDGAARWGNLIGLLASEFAIGLLLGFVGRMVFFAVDLCGGLVSSELGLNMGATLNPFSAAPGQAPGMILYYLAAVLFFALDLHHWLLLALQRSYGVLPIGGASLSQALYQDVIGQTGRVFVVGLQMAAPLIAVCFLINLTFSILGRVVPQMNVFAESFSFRILVGLILFGLTLNLMTAHVLNYVRRLPEDVLRVAQLMRGG